MRCKWTIDYLRALAHVGIGLSQALTGGWSIVVVRAQAAAQGEHPRVGPNAVAYRAQRGAAGCQHKFIDALLTIQTDDVLPARVLFLRHWSSERDVAVKRIAERRGMDGWVKPNSARSEHRMTLRMTRILQQALDTRAPRSWRNWRRCYATQMGAPLTSSR